MSKLKIYLAGPAFNPKQRQLTRELELFLENENYMVFSPFRDGIVIKPDDNEKIKRKAFLWNCEKIKEADVILAILDYVGAELFVTSSNKKKIKVNIPDIGTVWELGFAYSNNKLIVGYTKETRKINLMLAVGIDFMVSDISALTDVLENLTTYIIDKKYGYSKYSKKILENTRNKYCNQKLPVE